MSKSLRISYSGALYHITSRGDGREKIYLNDNDREVFLSVLSDVYNKFNWQIHAYCLMNVGLAPTGILKRFHLTKVILAQIPLQQAYLVQTPLIALIAADRVFWRFS